MKRSMCPYLLPKSRQSLDGQDLSPICLHGKQETRPNGFAVEKNGAAAAYSLLATQMRPSKPKMVAQEVSQRQTRLDNVLVLFAVDGQLNRTLCDHLIFRSNRSSRSNSSNGSKTIWTRELLAPDDLQHSVRT